LLGDGLYIQLFNIYILKPGLKEKLQKRGSKVFPKSKNGQKKMSIFKKQNPFMEKFLKKSHCQHYGLLFLKNVTIKLNIL